MKSYLPLCFLILLSSITAVSAQDAPAAAPAAPKHNGMDRMMTAANLTPDERKQYMAARDKALADNPDLKTSGDALKTEGAALHANTSATAEDKAAFMEKMKAQTDKMKAAMLKADPTIQPILDKLDKARADMMAKRAQQQQ